VRGGFPGPEPLEGARGPSTLTRPPARPLRVHACAGTFPLVFSLLSDLFEPSKRSSISAVVQVATGVGLAAGQGIAGFAGARRSPPTSPRPAHPRARRRSLTAPLRCCPSAAAGPTIGWRWPFVIVSLPAIAVAARGHWHLVKWLGSTTPFWGD
jgi:MFS family permease